MAQHKNFYITTPIYYANDKPHIGHAYTTILADVITRFYKLMGYHTFFLTGTDEHGQKVQQAADKRGIDPQAQVDEYHQRFKELWVKLGIEYDRFIRTTDDDHVALVQAKLQDLWDRDLIYSEDYEGWYSVGEERFFSEEELVDGKDPISGRPVEWLSERNYFFKMGSYQQQLLNYIEENPDFIQPEHRKNEVLGFLKSDLKDLCISRPKSRLSWGITLPFDEEFVTYVWFDALLNYVSGVTNIQHPDGNEPWPADYHLIGKDILTTHCVYWPTMLMAMQIPLPKHILAHGWWLSGESKMSKSSGNAVDPLAFIEEHGVDAVRYFLMRDMVLGQDATFTPESFIKRINSDLANDLGNGLNRVAKLIQSNLKGIVPAPAADSATAAEQEVVSAAGQARQQLFTLIQENKLSQALEEVMVLVRTVNRYLEQKAPWHIAKQLKDEDAARRASAENELNTTLYTAAEAIRLALVLLHPVMPTKTLDGLAMLGYSPKEKAISEADLDWGGLKGGEQLGPSQALFPRIQVEEPGNDGSGQNAATKGPNKNKKLTGGDEVQPAQKIAFMAGRIDKVEDHPEADALYVVQVHVGSESRQVCAGIKAHFTPTDLVGRKVVLVGNLKPAKLRGVESKGMLLAADLPDGKIALLDPGEAAEGTLLQFGQLPPVPKSKISIKDFDKLALKVQGGQVEWNGQPLGAAGQPVTVNAPDGAEVH